MIASLMVTGEYEMSTNKDGKIHLENNKISIKDIPFVRYRLKDSSNIIQYIQKYKQMFKYSCHVMELDALCPHTISILNELEQNELDDIIVFIYFEVYNEDLKDIGIGAEKMESLRKIAEKHFERLILVDKTTEMHMVQYNNLVSQVMGELGLEESSIAVCGSPLSIGDNCCLTAIKARELMALYGETDECPLPSAKHESMNHCGCIRHITIDRDMVNDGDAKSINIKRTINSSNNKTKNKKIMKKFKPKQN